MTLPTSKSPASGGTTLPARASATDELGEGVRWDFFRREEWRRDRLMGSALGDRPFGRLAHWMRDSITESEPEIVDAIDEAPDLRALQLPDKADQGYVATDSLLAASRLDLVNEDLLEDLAMLHLEAEATEDTWNSRVDRELDSLMASPARRPLDGESIDRQTLPRQPNRLVVIRAEDAPSATDSSDSPTPPHDSASSSDGALGDSGIALEDSYPSSEFRLIDAPSEAEPHPPLGVGQILKTDGGSARLQAFDLGTTPAEQEPAGAS
jgi:hypothetical protein